MANTVQAAVDVKINGDASDFEKAIKQVEKDFEDLGYNISKYVEDPTKVSIDTFKELKGVLKDAEANFVALAQAGKIDKDQYSFAKDAVKELGGEIDTAKNKFIEFKEHQDAVENKFQTIRSQVSSLNTELDKLSSTNAFSTSDELDTYSNKIEILKSKIADIKDVIPEQAYDKTMSELDGIQEKIQSIGVSLIGNDFSYIENSLQDIGDSIISYLFDPMSMSDEEVKRLNTQLNDTIYKILGIRDTLEESQWNNFFNTSAEQVNALKELLSLRDKEIQRQEEINQKQEEERKTREQIREQTRKQIEDTLNKVEKSTIFEEDAKALSKQLEIQEELNKAKEEGIKLNGGRELSDFELIDLQNIIEAKNGVSAFGDAADGSKDKSEALAKVLVGLAQKLGLSSSEASKLITALGAEATEAATAGMAVGALVGVIKLMDKAMTEAEKDLLDFAKSGLGAGIEGIEWFIDSIQDLIGNLEDALSEMEKFAEAGAEIQTSFYNINTTLNSEAGASITEFTHSLQDLYGIDSSTLAKDLKEIVSGANSLGASTDEMVLATQNMALMANDLSIFAGSFKKAAEDVGNAVAKGFVGRTSSLYGLLSKSEKDTLKSLNTEVERYNYLMERADRIRGRYVDYLDTEAGKVMQLKNQYSILTSNIERLVLGLYAKIAPVLTELLKAANAALTAIMKLFNINIDEGANTGIEGAADKITEALDETAESAKEAKKQLASFDDVIQINDDKNKRTTADEIAELSDIDLSGLYGLNDALDDANDRWAKFKQLLADKKYYEAGFELADQLAQMMEEIPWDKFKEKAREAASALANFLNGFNANKRFWKDLGITIAEALNTAVEALWTFADEFNFEDFGNSLGVAWEAFWDKFDEVKFAETVYKWIKGVFQTLNGFFKTRPLTKMMTSLATILDTFFNSIDQKDIDEMAETLLNILNDVGDAAVTLLKSVAGNTPKLIEIVKGLIKDLHDWVNGEGKKDLNEIGDSIVEILREFNQSGIIQDVGDLIRDFMRELKWGDIVAEFTNTELMIWWEGVKNWFAEKGNFIKGFFDETFGKTEDAFEFGLGVKLYTDLYESGKISEERYKELITGLAEQYGYNTEMAADSIKGSLDEAGNNIVAGIDGMETSVNNRIKEVHFDGITYETDTAENVHLAVQDQYGKIDKEFTWFEEETNKKIDLMQFHESDLSKAINIKDLEERVDAADKKISELAKIIDGLKESSKNLTEIIKELKDSKVIDKELEEFIIVVSNNIERAMTAWTTIEDNALKSLLQTYSDFLFEVQDSVNSVTDLFAGMSEDVATSVTELNNNVAGLKTKIETTLTDTKSFSAGLTIMRNLKEGLKQGWAEIKSWWNSSVAQNMSMTFNTPRGQFTNGFNIPKLMAAGGIVNSATNAIIGEAGREAVIPLENNNVMKDLAGEFAKALGNKGNNAPITIDLSKCQKTTYTRSELLSMGELITNSLKTYGVVVSMEY